MLRRLRGSAAASTPLATLLESCSHPVADGPQEVPLASMLEPSFKVCNPLIEVEVEWRRGCFDFEEPDWRSPVGAADNAETLRLRSG
jgi:hypothetical protein